MEDNKAKFSRLRKREQSAKHPNMIWAFYESKYSLFRGKAPIIHHASQHGTVQSPPCQMWQDGCKGGGAKWKQGTGICLGRNNTASDPHCVVLRQMMKSNRWRAGYKQFKKNQGCTSEEVDEVSWWLCAVIPGRWAQGILKLTSCRKESGQRRVRLWERSPPHIRLRKNHYVQEGTEKVIRRTLETKDFGFQFFGA